MYQKGCVPKLILLSYSYCLCSMLITKRADTSSTPSKTDTAASTTNNRQVKEKEHYRDLWLCFIGNVKEEGNSSY